MRITGNSTLRSTEGETGASDVLTVDADAVRALGREARGETEVNYNKQVGALEKLGAFLNELPSGLNRSRVLLEIASTADIKLVSDTHVIGRALTILAYANVTAEEKTPLFIEILPTIAQSKELLEAVSQAKYPGIASAFQVVMCNTYEEGSPESNRGFKTLSKDSLTRLANAFSSHAAGVEKIERPDSSAQERYRQKDFARGVEAAAAQISHSGSTERFVVEALKVLENFSDSFGAHPIVNAISPVRGLKINEAALASLNASFEYLAPLEWGIPNDLRSLALKKVSELKGGLDSESILGLRAQQFLEKYTPVPTFRERFRTFFLGRAS